MDSQRRLVQLLQTAELKARVGLYYIQKNGNDKDTLLRSLNCTDIEELYKSSQIYCRNLEKKVQERDKELKSSRGKLEEITRNNEAMLEEIEILNKKLEKYPRTIQALNSEICKLSRKVDNLEEQKKYMENQATQNESKVQQSQVLQQDLIHSQNYASRLQKHISSINREEVSLEGAAPVLRCDKAIQSSDHLSTEKPESQKPTQEMCVQLRGQHETIQQLRKDLALLREDCFDFTTIQGELKTLVDLTADVVPITAVTSAPSLSDTTSETLPDETLPDREYLISVDRVEVVGRLVPSTDPSLTLACHSSTSNSTSVIIQQGNTVSTQHLDLVLPCTLDKDQMTRYISRVTSGLRARGSVLVVMLGSSCDVTLYGSTDQPGLIHILLDSMLKMRKVKEELTVSVGIFVQSQMCDGLSEFATEDGRVTAAPVTSLDQGTQLLSRADIPDEADQVLHQFSLRSPEHPSRSVTILECGALDEESCDLLARYRGCGRGGSGSKANVVYDTILTHSDKAGPITVFLNLKPDIASAAESSKLLKYASHITGIEPSVQTKKRGLFSFRN